MNNGKQTLSGGVERKMKEIELSRGKVALVDDEDFEWLNQWKWSTHSKGYAYRMDWGSRKAVYMHRLIMKTPKHLECDHIDHNKTNNQKHNLRNCTRHSNSKNMKRHKDGSSGYVGVYWCKPRNKWVANICVDGKTIYLGASRDKKKCAKMYDVAASKYRGEYANLNLKDNG